ncbi:hypothetical protein GBA52_013007 [Prunus armeniaca]|nr:hypothetical protein GBA52_013007 [Prunus armeniaca]
MARPAPSPETNSNLRRILSSTCAQITQGPALEERHKPRPTPRSPKSSSNPRAQLRNPRARHRLPCTNDLEKDYLAALSHSPNSPAPLLENGQVLNPILAKAL